MAIDTERSMRDEPLAEPNKFPDTPAPFQRYEVHPPLVAQGKHNRRVAATDILSIGVQSLAAKGGETNLHAHADQDATWLVMNGKVRFYTEGDKEVATLGQYEGLVIPRGTLYWFESASEEPLVIMRIAAKHPDVEKARTDRGDRVSREGTTLIEGAFFGR
jgi:mannose-6-phosphate isomerase-like protein (cupin superfamily)